jgi:hypothetical protein
VTELVAFVGLVALVAVIGVVVGMIVAGRLDRRLGPPVRTRDVDAAPAPTTSQEDRS